MDFSFQNGSNCKCFDISDITKAYEDKSLTRTRCNLMSCDIFLELNFLHTVAVHSCSSIFYQTTIAKTVESLNFLFFFI